MAVDLPMPVPPNDYVFLLGGQDLEMQTIRALLQEHGQDFHDRELRWGARASDLN